MKSAALLLSVFFVVASAHANPPATRYRVVPLPVPVGAQYGVVAGLNDRGDALINGIYIRDVDQRVFIYHDGALQSLGSFPGHHFIVGEKMNNAGQAIAFAYPELPYNSLSLFYNGRVLAEFPPPVGGEFLRAQGINDLGQVCGQARFEGSNGQWTAPGVVVSNGIYSVLPPVSGAAQFAPFVINNAGVMAGVASTGQEGALQAVVYKDGVYTTLHPGNAWPNDMNERGDVVGALNEAPGTQGFLYSGGKMIFLSQNPTRLSLIPHSINEARAIVGSAETSRHSYPFLWVQGEVTDINRLVPGNEIQIYHAGPINNQGVIAANGVHRRTGAHSAMLLVPIPARRGL